jgi:short-subunit dehydrogenase
VTLSVVTGAGRGIGRAFAMALAERGASIVLGDIDREAAEQTADAARRAGAEAFVVPCDVTSTDDLLELAERWPAPDLVVANAGIMVLGEARATDLAAFRRVVDVNLFGVVHTCQAFTPSMIARGRGAILNVASLAGLIPAPLMGCYAATKAGVIAYGDALRAELRPHGVTVTTLCPSFTRTELIERAAGDDESAFTIGRRIMDRIGASPDAVARLGLRAARAGAPYAIPTIHGRLAHRFRRLAPDTTAHLASAAYMLLKGTT